MKKTLYALVAVLMFAASTPGQSDAVGFVKYFFDAVANTLGLDRGPIPKVMRQAPPAEIDLYRHRIPPHVYVQEVHIQADGF